MTNPPPAPPAPPAPPTPDDFYVGYLPTPPSHRRALRWLVPALAAALAGAAGLAALAQRDPGPAVWADQPLTVEGTLVASPYPFVLEGEGPDARAVFLVEQGKHGAGPRAGTLHGRPAQASGLPLKRDGRMLLELTPGPDGLRPLDTPGTPPTPTPIGRARLRGEIIDSKCAHGAMKPGDGKAHKACATLCISNGIPPMLRAVGPDDPRNSLVLLASNSPAGLAPLDPAFLEYIGEPVEVQGELFELGPVRVLVPDPGTGVRRTGP